MRAIKMLAVLCGVAASATFVMAADPASAAGLGEAGELEAARANARAGGPVSERDFELLERWGCTSGTNNPVCDRGRGKQVHRYDDNGHKPRRAKKRAW
jgi:hypothetical protein